jgi:hypothetical protein
MKHPAAAARKVYPHAPYFVLSFVRQRGIRWTDKIMRGERMILLVEKASANKRG